MYRPTPSSITLRSAMASDDSARPTARHMFSAPRWASSRGAKVAAVALVCLVAAAVVTLAIVRQNGRSEPSHSRASGAFLSSTPSGGPSVGLIGAPRDGRPPDDAEGERHSSLGTHRSRDVPAGRRAARLGHDRAVHAHAEPGARPARSAHAHRGRGRQPGQAVLDPPGRAHDRSVPDAGSDDVARQRPRARARSAAPRTRHRPPRAGAVPPAAT